MYWLVLQDKLRFEQGRIGHPWLFEEFAYAKKKKNCLTTGTQTIAIYHIKTFIDYEYVSSTGQVTSLNSVHIAYMQENVKRDSS